MKSLLFFLSFTKEYNFSRKVIKMNYSCMLCIFLFIHLHNEVDRWVVKMTLPISKVINAKLQFYTKNWKLRDSRTKWHVWSKFGFFITWNFKNYAIFNRISKRNVPPENIAIIVHNALISCSSFITLAHSKEHNISQREGGFHRLDKNISLGLLWWVIF